MSEEEQVSVSSPEALGSLFKALAEATFTDRRAAFDLGLNLSEETMTELCLFRLASEAPEIYVRAFAKREEHRNGADWEWCFVSIDPHASLRLRVQAKALYHPSKCYEALHFKPGKDQQVQLDTFIRRCEREGLPGAYCFYNYELPSLTPPYGVTMADPLNVQGVGATALTKVLTVSVPWHRLFEPAEDPIHSALPFVVHRSLTELRSKGSSGSKVVPQPDGFWPNYVGDLLGLPAEEKGVGPPPGAMTRLQTIADLDSHLAGVPVWQRTMQERNPHLSGVAVFIDASAARRSLARGR